MPKGPEALGRRYGQRGGPKVQLGIRLSPELHAAIDQYAERHNISLNTALVTALESFLNGKAKEGKAQ